MNTNSHEEKWLHGDLVYNVIGSAIEVMKELGHGLHEKPYENSMVVEMGLRGLTWQQQPRYDVFYKGVLVSEYVPDLIVANAVVVDSKVIDRITDHERGQILNYLRITKLRVGLIINFKHAKLEWERMVL
jgi:GxxExxY protein